MERYLWSLYWCWKVNLLRAWVTFLLQGFCSRFPQKHCLRTIYAETVMARVSMLGCVDMELGAMPGWRARHCSDIAVLHRELELIKWDLPSGTKYEPTAETLIQVTEVASHSLNSEFGRLINFLLIIGGGRAGKRGRVISTCQALC